jgi:hypothetical protein
MVQPVACVRPQLHVDGRTHQTVGEAPGDDVSTGVIQTPPSHLPPLGRDELLRRSGDVDLPSAGFPAGPGVDKYYSITGPT